MNAQSDNTVIRFTKPARHTSGAITRVSGLVEARYLIKLLETPDLLQANPREAERGKVTRAICSSIEDDPSTFPYKTKGVLIGASGYQEMERDRWNLTFSGETEGLLDGGHNMLALGLHALKLIFEKQELEDKEIEKNLNKVKDWQSFLAAWGKNGGEFDSVAKEMDFLVPVEVLVPEDPGNEGSVKLFRFELFEICKARNNNRQLTTTTTGNQRGFYNGIKEALPADLVEQVEWRENAGGRIPAADIVALAWIPLNLLLQQKPPILKAKDGKDLPKPISQTAIYSRKGSCVDAFEKLAERILGPAPHKSGSDDSEDFRQPFLDEHVNGAFKILADLPRLHDLLYRLLPDAYNKNDGAFGRIRYVENPQDKTRSGKPKNTKNWKTHYFQEPFPKHRYPTAYITPLLYGLQSLMEIDKSGQVVWSRHLQGSPDDFIERNLQQVVTIYKEVLASPDYDPQKVGKGDLSYSTALAEFKSALREEEYARMKERIGSAKG